MRFRIMKPSMALCLWLVAWSFQVIAQAPEPPDAGVAASRYTLLDGSYLTDNCLICGRVTIPQPLRGTFDLVLVQNTAPYTKYAIRNLNFSASPAFAGEVGIKGDGSYVRFEEVAVLQTMNLDTEVVDAYTNVQASFTNDSSAVTQPFPMIAIDLTQTNGTLLRTFSMHLLAAPLRELWFSTAKAFTSTNRFPPTNYFSAGDLISNRGRVVR